MFPMKCGAPVVSHINVPRPVKRKLWGILRFIMLMMMLWNTYVLRDHSRAVQEKDLIIKTYVGTPQQKLKPKQEEW